MSPRALATSFAFGAVFGSIFDGFHTFSGTTAYPSPVLLRMAIWTPALFGGAFALMAFVYTLTRRASDVEPARPWLGFAIFGALYFASGFLPASNAVKLAVLLAGAALLYALGARGRAPLVAAIVSAVIGPSFEIALVHVGAFAHLQPDVAGIPIWLPGLYFASGFGLGPAVFRLVTRAAPVETGLAAARPLR